MTTACEALEAPAMSAAPQPPQAETRISITFHDDGVPMDLAMEMDALYQNLYSSLFQFELTHETSRLHAYVARAGREPIAILVFEVKKSVARVINSVIRLDEQEIARFTRALFARYPSVGAVEFHAIQTDAANLSRPYQRFSYSEDIVVSLPPAVNTYLDALGKSTKKNVKYYSNKLKRNFPSFQYKVYRKEEITESLVREILQVKQARMADKNKAVHNDEGEVERIMRMARLYGLVGAATIDGRICAGSIGYLIGTHAFGGVLAHDPQYDSYWIGMLCCYLTISACIEMGCTEYHFQWGQDDYKFRLLGVQRDLDNLVVYRSSLHAALNPVTALRTECAGRIRLARRWLTDPRNRDKPLVKLAARASRLLHGPRNASKEKPADAAGEEAGAEQGTAPAPKAG